MTSDFYLNLSSRDATKISESTYQWDLPVPLQLEARAQFECGLVRAILPSLFKADILPAGFIRYKMQNEDAIKVSRWEQARFIGLSDLVDQLNGSLVEEISDHVIFRAGAGDFHVLLEVKEPVEFLEFDEQSALALFLGFDVYRFEYGNYYSASVARTSMFSNQLNVYTDFTESRICNGVVAPLLASIVLPDTAQCAENVTFNHIEYMGLTRLDLRNITLTITHSNNNEPFLWHNPINQYLSFTLHLRRANLFDI